MGQDEGVARDGVEGRSVRRCARMKEWQVMCQDERVSGDGAGGRSGR